MFTPYASSSSGVDTGDIGHSLRVRSAASAYLSRTFGTPTSQTRGLVSLWYKPGWLLGGVCNAVFLATTNPTISGLIIGGTGAFGSTYENRLFIRNGGANKDYWNLVFRDPTSWYHIVVSFDTTQGTQADRAKCWVNGVEQTKGGSSLGASEAIGFLASGTQTINGNTASYYGDQCLARFVLMDGQCVQQSTASVSSFGYLNTEINEWVSKSQSAVKAVVDAGGTNSFMLDFDDATSLTTLGYDKSSKGNNWTLNNFSLTAGTTYDRMLDVPGNSFATLNPLVDMAGSPTLSKGNLAITGDAAWNDTIASQYFSEGKIVYEFYPYDQYAFIGVCGTAYRSGQTDPHTKSGQITWYGSTGAVWVDGSATGTNLGTFNGTNRIRVEINKDANTVQFYKDNVAAGSAQSLPSSISGGSVAPICHINANGQTAHFNFGQAPLHSSAAYHSGAGGYFADSPSANYKALCQRNMPDPAILNPEKHFDVIAYAGLGTGNPKTLDADFDIDFAWIKKRSGSGENYLWDTVRGGGNTKALASNSTSAEGINSAYISQSFSAGNVIVDNAGAGNELNTGTLVDWLWKAGGAAVTNNAGSISSQVSANVEAGFSIVTYTGTGANATVGHGLGKAPGLVIAKARNATGYWVVYNKFSGASFYMYLNTTHAATSGTVVWQGVEPTSSVFSLGTGTDANANTQTHVAYCFAEIPGYSKIFSYTGNGSADGPFVHCGFKPKLILLKRTDAGGDDWVMLDCVRNTYNVVNLTQSANASSAENTTNCDIDFLSNGFKVRHTAVNYLSHNTSGGTYIGIAFADVPAKYALAR